MDAFEAASLADSVMTPKKIFSVSEANRSLALVRKIVADIVRDYEQLRGLHDRCRKLEARGEVADAGRARDDYARINDHLSELNEELEKVGCEIKDYHTGLVFFPSFKNGREIFLSWLPGEDGVHHWHEVDAGITDRQPLAEY